jgi:hypothetical protein
MAMTTQQYNEYVDHVVETALANTAAFAKVMEARDAQLELLYSVPVCINQLTNIDRYEDDRRRSAEQYAIDVQMRARLGQ